MDKPPFNPKWSFRSQAFHEESFRKRILKQYDAFVNRQLDKLPPNLRYIRVPMRPITYLLIFAFVAGNNIVLSTCLPIQRGSRDTVNVKIYTVPINPHAFDL